MRLIINLCCFLSRFCPRAQCPPGSSRRGRHCSVAKSQFPTPCRPAFGWPVCSAASWSAPSPISPFALLLVPWMQLCAAPPLSVFRSSAVSPGSFVYEPLQSLVLQSALPFEFVAFTSDSYARCTASFSASDSCPAKLWVWLDEPPLVSTLRSLAWSFAVPVDLAGVSVSLPRRSAVFQTRWPAYDQSLRRHARCSAASAASLPMPAFLSLRSFSRCAFPPVWEARYGLLVVVHLFQL